MKSAGRTIDLLKDLVGFDTTSSKSNLRIIHFIRDYLASFRIPSELIEDESGTKANLLATIGPAEVPGVVLSGHTDVVPALEGDWTTPPFSLNERDGRLYGRGCADMKGFVAAVLAQVPEFIAADLRHPVHFSFSYDEELGCLGVRRLLPRLMNMPARPALCIVGEPTMMRVVMGHKGKIMCETHVHGHACHSAQAPLGVNAVEYAAELIAYIRSEAHRIRCEGPFDRGYVIPHTTLNVGPIAGGTVTNVVAHHCRFEWEIRHLPDQDPGALVERISDYARRELEPRMRSIALETAIETSVSNSYPGLDMDEQEHVVSYLQALLDGASRGKVDFGTEGGFFQKVAGIPTLVCGPGDIAVAHKSNEYVELSQLEQANTFLDRLTARLSCQGALDLLRS